MKEYLYQDDWHELCLYLEYNHIPMEQVAKKLHNPHILEVYEVGK